MVLIKGVNKVLLITLAGRLIILTGKARTYLSGALLSVSDSLFYPKKIDKTLPWREKEKRQQRDKERKNEGSEESEERKLER